MAKVFISYRRADSATFSGRIYDRLVAKFGRKNVFKDVDNIPPGVDFAEYIQTSLQQCAVALVIMGPRWADVRLPDGTLRLQDPNDAVRIEIETAVGLGLTILPILADNAAMPVAAQLPESLHKLLRINALAVREDPDFARDMERVIEALERAFANRPARGLFGRRPTSSQARAATPAPAESFAPAPSSTPAPYVPPVEAPLGIAPAAPIAGGVAEQPVVAAKVNRQAEGASAPARAGNRPLVAGLAVLLVVLAIAGLLSTRIVGQIQAGNAANTRTAMANGTSTSSAIASKTAAYAPTATFIATPLYPYQTNTPGPKCDKGQLIWTLSGSSEPANGVQCASNHTHLVGVKICGSTGSECYLGAGFDFDASSQVKPFPTNFTVSCQFSNVGASTQFGVGFEDAGDSGGLAFSLDATIYGDGAYSFGGFRTTADLAKGRIDLTGPHTVTVTVNNRTLTVKLDGRQQFSKSMGFSLSAMSWFVSSGPPYPGQNLNGLKVSADVTAFSVQPL